MTQTCMQSPGWAASGPARTALRGQCPVLENVSTQLIGTQAKALCGHNTKSFLQAFPIILLGRAALVSFPNLRPGSTEAPEAVRSRLQHAVWPEGLAYLDM